MKQKVCIAGIALGIIMMILGIVVLSGSSRDADALLSFDGEEPERVSFGSDYNTYSYKASRATANNLADLGELVEDAVGVLLLTLGAGGALLSLYGYASCQESGAPTRPAASAPVRPSVWTCDCGTINPASKSTCESCGAAKPVIAAAVPHPAPAPIAPSPIASVASRMKAVLKSTGDATPEWATQKSRPEPSPEWAAQKSRPEPRPERRPASGDAWLCACGASNHVSKGACDACGETKPVRAAIAAAAPAPAPKKAPTVPGAWTCSCGAQWPAHRGTCESCGERKPR